MYLCCYIDRETNLKSGKYTFSISKSSIKTKTVLTMTDITESTELLAFKRQKDGYKVTVKISLCICVVISIVRRTYSPAKFTF